MPKTASVLATAPIVMVAGTCMNSGKTYAATEIIKHLARTGQRVAAAMNMAGQADSLVSSVARFKLPGGAPAVRPAPKPVEKKQPVVHKAKPKPAKPAPAPLALAPAAADGDWKEI